MSYDVICNRVRFYEVPLTIVYDFIRFRNEIVLSLQPYVLKSIPLWCGGPAVLWSLACDACPPPGRGKDVAGTIRNRYEIVRFRKGILTKSYDFTPKSYDYRTISQGSRYEIAGFHTEIV